MNNNKNEADNKLKIRILAAGPAATGKTAIIERFLHNKFRKDYIMTMGGEIHVKSLRIDGRDIDLIINDLPGEERFKVARESFYSDAAGALVIFDLTRYTTFKPGIFERLKELWENTGKIPIIIVGNKKDLADQGFRSIKKEDISEYCKKIPCTYIETSAQDGTGIDKAFNSLIRIILQNSF
ncbi:MAG: GTP-binding protein [Candidatus Helarchaeota archaeon]|nr:GTP-binding protein [Candidatus Helarchaeota archaeon]